MITHSGPVGDLKVTDWAGDEAIFHVDELGGGVTIESTSVGRTTLIDLSHSDAITLMEWLSRVTG